MSFNGPKPRKPIVSPARKPQVHDETKQPSPVTKVQLRDALFCNDEDRYEIREAVNKLFNGGEIGKFGNLPYKCVVTLNACIIYLQYRITPNGHKLKELLRGDLYRHGIRVSIQPPQPDVNLPERITLSIGPNKHIRLPDEIVDVILNDEPNPPPLPPFDFE